jgi:hypothetical protein
MKKVLQFLAIATFLLTGCKKEDAVTLDPTAPADQMHLTAAPAGEITLSKDNADAVALAFTWAEAKNRGEGTSITYRFQLSLASKTWESTADLKSRSISFTHAQLNNILTGQLDITGTDAVEITALVSAEVTASIQMQPETSTATVSITPFPSDVTNISTLLVEGDGDSNSDNDEENVFHADLDIAQNQQLLPGGSLDISDWWIDPDFFEKTEEGLLTFLPIDGKYRIIANKGRKYFRVQALKANGDLAELENDGSGAIYAYGDVGNPTIANLVGWEPRKAVCLAPIGDKKYKLSGVAGERFKSTGLGIAFGPKFDDWRKIRRPEIPANDENYGDPRYAPLADAVSEFIIVDTNTDDNVHLNGWNMQIGHTYTLILDASNGYQAIQLSILEDGVPPTPMPDNFPVTINGTSMTKMNNNGDFKADVNLTQNAPVAIGGVEPAEFASWWLDPDFIGVNEMVPYLVPKTGRYRVIANIRNMTFKVEPLDADDNPATLQLNGDGTVWVIGAGLGKPNLSANRSNNPATNFDWITEDALPMAPMGDGTFRITLKAGGEDAQLYSTLINFKFFYQRGWGGEFRGTNDQITQYNGVISTASPLVTIVPDGNVVLTPGQSFENGATYRFTVNITGGLENIKLFVDKL